MNKIFLNNVGDLSEAPRASYIRFLIKGIREELSYIPLFLYTKNLNMFIEKHNITRTLIYKNEIKFKFTGVKVSKAYLKKKNYSIYLFIKGRKLLDKNISHIYNKVLKKNIVPFIETFFLLGKIPLLTKEGSFIINGCERIMINQIIKSPGIYFKKIIKTKEPKIIYTAIIVSKNSKYTRILYERSKREPEKTYITLNNFASYLDYKSLGKADCDSNKLYIFDIINYFFESKYKNIPNFKYPKHLFNQRLTQKRNNRNKYLSLEQKAKISKIMNNIIETIYLTKDNHFSIGTIGRYNLNKKLGLNLSKNITTLTHLDFIRIMEMLIELKYFGRSIDDIDNLKEKHIRSLGNFFQITFKEVIKPIMKKFFHLRTETKSLKYNTKTDSLSKKNSFFYSSSFTKNKTIFKGYSSNKNKKSKMLKAFKRSFLTNSLAQYMDQINPLAESTQKRRISVLGLFGLNKDSIPKKIRDIHPSRHGKICIIETPEGKNAGIITSIAMYARINLYGSFETPYFLIKNYTVLKKKKPIYLNSFEDSSISISYIDFNLNKLNLITQKYLSVKENYSFNIKKTNLVKLLTTSQIQIISLGSSLVPFIEHNDASRALMGSNMQRQAVPLFLSEVPLIGTNLEIAASTDSGMTLKNYSEGITLDSNSKRILIKDKNGFIISYNLKKYKCSNQNTSYNQKACVWTGEVVFSNQIIGDGPSTYHGELSLGKNLILAYMPWEGYNFEDAILINEKLAYENILTSIHIHEQNLILHDFIPGFEILSNKSPYHTKYIKRHLNEKGIPRIGSYAHGKDILIGKLTRILNQHSTLDENFLESVFGSSVSTKYKDTSLYLPEKLEGRIIA